MGDPPDKPRVSLVAQSRSKTSGVKRALLEVPLSLQTACGAMAAFRLLGAALPAYGAGHAAPSTSSRATCTAGLRGATFTADPLRATKRARPGCPALCAGRGTSAVATEAVQNSVFELHSFATELDGLRQENGRLLAELAVADRFSSDASPAGDLRTPAAC